MTEYEEAREAIAKIIDIESYYCLGIDSDECKTFKSCNECFADQILKLPNVAVLAKDQPIARVLLWQESIDADRQGALMNRVTSVDGGHIQSAYWCKTCDDYLAEHRHDIDFDNGFDYGDLLNFDDYIPFSEVVNAK
jgi:hypothetical protein